MSQSELERAFETRWKQLDGPELEREYRFHPDRKWRIDYFHKSGVGVEIEGGIHIGGRHTRAVGYTLDCIKYNQAVLMGLKLFRLTGDMLESDPAGHLQPIIELMRKVT